MQKSDLITTATEFSVLPPVLLLDELLREVVCRGDSVSRPRPNDIEFDGLATGSPLHILVFVSSLFCMSQVVTCEGLW